MSYGTAIPVDSLIVLILLTFSVALPLVSVAALLYFVLSYFYFRYDLLYTKREAFQSGGMFWPVVRLSFLLSVDLSGLKPKESIRCEKRSR
jgi:hypothetical protein